MPCRPLMAGCKVTCGHWRIVNDYHQERDRQLEAADAAGNGYTEEYNEYVKSNPIIHFKQWLIQTRRGTT